MFALQQATHDQPNDLLLLWIYCRLYFSAQSVTFSTQEILMYGSSIGLVVYMYLIRFS